MTDDRVNIGPNHEGLGHETDGSMEEENIEPEREPAPDPVRAPRRRGPTPTRGATGDVILQVHIANIFLARVHNTANFEIIYRILIR